MVLHFIIRYYPYSFVLVHSFGSHLLPHSPPTIPYSLILSQCTNLYVKSHLRDDLKWYSHYFCIYKATQRVLSHLLLINLYSISLVYIFDWSLNITISAGMKSRDKLHCKSGGFASATPTSGSVTNVRESDDPGPESPELSAIGCTWPSWLRLLSSSSVVIYHWQLLISMYFYCHYLSTLNYR